MNQQDRSTASRHSRTEYEYNALLSRLVGYHLQSVHFNGGYVQFSFAHLNSAKYPVLTCEVMPTVETPSGALNDGDPGYADAIRGLIGQHVTATHEAPLLGLRIEFAEVSVKVRPAADELRGPQIAMLSDFSDVAPASWQPGGQAFEYLA